MTAGKRERLCWPPLIFVSANEGLLAAAVAEGLVLDWRKQQQARVAVKLAIEDALDRGLPTAYSPAMFKQKCEAVYLHVYDSYYGAGRSLYALAT